MSWSHKNTIQIGGYKIKISWPTIINGPMLRETIYIIRALKFNSHQVAPDWLPKDIKALGDFGEIGSNKLYKQLS